MAKTSNNLNETMLIDLNVNSLLNSPASNPQYIEISKKSMAKTNHKINKTLLLNLK